MPDYKLPQLSSTTPDYSDLTYLVDVSDLTDDVTGSSRSLSLARLLGLIGIVPGGRLTTETGVGVSTSDRTSQSTLYYTPYVHNRISIFDGTQWLANSFTERSLVLSGLTSGKNYDVFIYNNAGTLTLELSAAWTDDVTRADALLLQDGVYVKSSATTRLWLGTVRSTSTTTIEDSATKRFTWNRYNQAKRRLAVTDATASWTYSLAAYRQARASSANQVEAVIGLAGSHIQLQLWAIVSYSATNANVSVGVGMDSTSAIASESFGGQYQSSSTSAAQPPTANYNAVPAAGYHYWAWLEKGDGTGTQTWYGSDSSYRKPGLTGWIEG